MHAFPALQHVRSRLNTAATRMVARLLVRAGSRSVGRWSTPAGAPPAAPRPERFDVYTFVTDEQQYRQLRDSFAAAGFGPPVARFVALRDRRHADGTDPYELISRIGSQRDRPYAILVHQDVRLDQGFGRRELVDALERLDELDPRWSVAGNAGGAPDLRLIRRLRDPHGGGTNDRLPAPVVSLDENFLVLNPAASVRCSPELSGFHFYGTDVCLHALGDGGAAYVIDFPVTHLSPGRRGPDYEDARRRFVAVWQERFLFALVRTPTEILLLTRSRLLRRLLGSPRVQDWVSSGGVRQAAR